MEGEEPCLCLRDDPPVYRLFRPFASPDPSDDGSQPTERSVAGEEPMVWDTVPDYFVDEPPVDHEGDEPDTRLDDTIDANHGRFGTEHQLWFDEVEAPFPEWTLAGTSQVFSDYFDEGSPANESSSILERLADFLNF